MFVPQSRVGIFRNDAHDPPHWTLNSCFGVFRTIWVYLVPFGYLTKLGAKWAEVVQNSCHEVASEFFAMNAPDPPHWTLNSCFLCFVLFECIWYRLVAIQNSVQYGLKWCKSLCHGVVSEFFTTN